MLQQHRHVLRAAHGSHRHRVHQVVAAAQHRVGAVSQQQTHRLGVAGRLRSGLLELHRAVQRPVAMRGGRQDVDVRRMVDQVRDHLVMTAVAGVHQHLPVAGDPDIGRDRDPYRFQVAPAGGNGRRLHFQPVHGCERTKLAAGRRSPHASVKPRMSDGTTERGDPLRSRC